MPALKPQPRIAALLTAVVAALALGTAIAPQAFAAEWEIEGKTLAKLGIGEESLTISEGELTLELTESEAELTCEVAEGTGAIVGKGEETTTVELSACSIVQHPEKCTVTEPIVAKLKGTLAEHGGEGNIYISLAPSAKIVIKITGAECPLGKESEVSGKATAELVPQPATEQPLIFSRSIAELLSTSLLFGAQTAYSTGELVTKLSGAHAGAEWTAANRNTVLCETGSNGCPVKDVYPAKTTLAAELESGTNAVFEGGFGVVKCTASSLSGETTGEKAEPLPGSIASLSFTSCKLGETACTLTTEKLPFSATLAVTGSGDGSLLLTGKEKGTAGVGFSCGKLLSCAASGNLTLDFEGGEPAQILAGEETLTGEGSCSKITFTATYSLSAPNSGYAFANEALVPNTLLCSATPVLMANRLKCPQGTAYSGEIKGELAVGLFEMIELVGAGKTFSCNEASYTGQFERDGDPAAVMGGITSLTLSSKVGGVPGQRCASNYGGGASPTVKLTPESLPYAKTFFKYERFDSHEGLVNFDGPLKIKAEVYNTAGALQGTCVYTSPIMWGEVFNGAGANPTQLAMKYGFISEAGGWNECAAIVQVRGRLTAKTPTGNVYIARE